MAERAMDSNDIEREPRRVGPLAHTKIGSNHAWGGSKTLPQLEAIQHEYNCSRYFVGRQRNALVAVIQGHVSEAVHQFF